MVVKPLQKLIDRLRKFKERAHLRPFQAAFRHDVTHALEAQQFERDHLHGVTRFPDHSSLLEYTLRQVDPQLNTWIELGVGKGQSLRAIAATARGLGLTPDLHGFDSFQGLPEDFVSGVPKGSFATSGSRFSPSSRWTMGSSR